MAAHAHTTSIDSLERFFHNFYIHDSIRGGTTRTIPSQKLETTSGHDLIIMDLNSEISLPYMWEQCLDLKNGDIYFINRRNGVKTKEDPREMDEYRGEYYYSDDEEDQEGDGDDDSCDYGSDEEGCGSNVVKGEAGEDESDEDVLVAAGCRSCLMYHMVSKQLNDCPKCNRQLLHFDRLRKPSSYEYN